MEISKNFIKYPLTICFLSACVLCGCTANATSGNPMAETGLSTDAVPEAEGNTGEAIPYDEAFTDELFAMDTVMTLTAYGPGAMESLDAGKAEIERLDALFSISSETGDIYKLNLNKTALLSEDTFMLLSRSLEISGETGGAFDCTIEPVMEAWSFTDQNYKVPTEDEIASLLEHVDYSKVDMGNHAATLPEGMSVDLGGIAKGYASSRVMDIFESCGVKSGIVSLGGNVQVLGSRPDGSPWRVGIQDPWDSSGIYAVIEVSDTAVVTSGAYQRYFEENGEVYHHIIDPSTGYPADSGFASVTVISSDGTLADALSTALYIMGPEGAFEYWSAHRNDFEAVFIDSSGDISITEGMKNSFKLKVQRNVQVVL